MSMAISQLDRLYMSMSRCQLRYKIFNISVKRITKSFSKKNIVLKSLNSNISRLRKKTNRSPQQDLEQVSDDKFF